MFVFKSVHVLPLHFIQRFGSFGKLSLNSSSYKEIFSYGEFCLKLSLLASLPAHYGGLDGRVIYIDVESKFSSRRMIEIGARSFPEIFHLKGMAQEMAGRILVLWPTSLSEFTERFDLKQDSIFLSLRNDIVGLEAAKSFKAVC
ncbi:hypothetical protein Q3G72_028735 [Acer saccharum]|nr:hypothetical protein Q3G72_028735 [Acer saccharum]